MRTTKSMAAVAGGLGCRCCRTIPYLPSASISPGHIEIRTYDGFVSDYYKNTPVNYFSGGYEVTGIYRKVYDEKVGKRQDAFLKMLRILESEETWNALNYPIDGKKRFSDMSKHPWLDRDTNIIPTGHSTAAGAYQITRKTYNGVRQRPYYVHGIKFDPNSQTHMAIRILEDRRQKGDKPPSALTLIRQGKIEEAINSTSLYKEWVSLPGGESQRVKSMQAFIEQWRKYT